MKILVRLPNWLGDMVMSVAFIDQLKKLYPEAEISVIAKKGIHPLLNFFPPTQNQYIFSKDEYGGLKGAFNFGRLIRSQQQYDLFFSLPDSFSSAVMAYGTGAKERVGFKKELRSGLLTRSVRRPTGLHRVDEYLQLLSLYTGKAVQSSEVKLIHDVSKKEHIVVNINSEASSRRLPAHKAVSLLNCLRKHSNSELVLIGSQREKPFVETVFNSLDQKSSTHVVAGNTSVAELVDILASAKAVLTTDSGPAHLANALNVPTVVLFGAGDETNTSPYNQKQLDVIRLGQLKCEPCKSNTCRLYEEPKCLTLLDELSIVKSVLKYA
jgi:heptosyltransferase II